MTSRNGPNPAIALGLTTILAISLLPWSNLRAEEDHRAALSQWDQAQEAITLGELLRARDLLESSYEAHPHGMTACELGRLSRRLERRPSAVYWLRICAGDERLLPEFREAAAQEALVLEQQVGALSLPRLPLNTRLLVDGRTQEIPQDGRDLLLVPGRHEIVLERPSGRRWQGDIVVRPGERSPMEVLSLLPEDRTNEYRRRYRALRIALWTTLAVSLTIAVGLGVAIGYDIQLSEEQSPEAEQARLASGILGGLTGLGMAVGFSLIPFLTSARRSVRITPQEGSSGEVMSLLSRPPALRFSR